MIAVSIRLISMTSAASFREELLEGTEVWPAADGAPFARGTASEGAETSEFCVTVPRAALG
jgi:hypothetical protein